MKILSNHNEGTALSTMELDFANCIDLENVNICDTTLTIPLFTNDKMLDVLAGVADEAAAEADFPYVGYSNIDISKTEVNILVDTCFNSFMFDLVITVYPKFKLPEGTSHSEFFDFQLSDSEKTQLLWIIVRNLFDKAYYSETVKAIPVSA
ncbi:MAG: hypothetical protein P4L45_09860 [Ignavibacteriaceae bacterium]|nr:hypothetical protein [Ignavibacteriaceae bacterium]